MLLVCCWCVSFSFGRPVMYDLDCPGINISVVINYLSTLKFLIGDGQFRLPWIMYFFSLSNITVNAAQHQKYKH